MGRRWVGTEVKRFEFFLVNLGLVISPNEMNRFINTVIIAPLTTQGRNYPTRIGCEFRGKEGQVVLGQIRTVDKARLVKRLGTVESKTQKSVLLALAEMFAP